MDSDTIEVILTVVVFLIFAGVGIARAVANAMRAGREEREATERRRMQQPYGAAAGESGDVAVKRAHTLAEVRRFVEDVQRQTAQALGQQAPAPPQAQRPMPQAAPSPAAPRSMPPPPRAARQQPAVVRSSARPAQPALVQPAKAGQDKAPPEIETASLQEVGPPVKAAAQAQAEAGRERLSAALPQDELQRAVLLREILGPPRAMNPYGAVRQ